MSNKAEGIFRSKVYWTQIQNPNKFGQYCVNIAVDDVIEKKLVSLRLDKKIKSGKDIINNGGKYLSLRLAEVDTKGVKSKMVVLDTGGKIFKGLVGNGSICDVYWHSYESPMYGSIIKLGKLVNVSDDKRTRTYGALKVVELVEFSGGPSEEFMKAIDTDTSSEDTSVPFDMEVN